mgnify:FL=1
MESLEMTRLQCAYQLSKEAETELCGISCQVYLEFDTKNLDYERLNEAWHALYLRHEILRGRSYELGYIDFVGEEEFVPIEIRDISGSEREIFNIRQELCEREWSLEENMAKMLVIKDASGIKKLCLTMSLMFADPLSFQILLDDFTDYYINGLFSKTIPQQTLHEYYDIVWKCSREEKRLDKDYWKKRVEEYGRGYRVPAGIDKRYNGIYESYDAALTEKEWLALAQCAMEKNILLEDFLLGVYAWILKEAIEETKLVINYPVFTRDIEYQYVIGDFSRNLLVGLDLSSVQTCEELMQVVTCQIQEDRKHMKVDGLEVQGMYNRILENDSYKEAVVFSPSLYRDLVTPQFTKQIGKLVYLASKTPMVALDAQFYQLNGGLLLTWVVPQNWFEAGKIKKMLEDYVELCRRFSDSTKWKERLDGR